MGSWKGTLRRTCLTAFAEENFNIIALGLESGSKKALQILKAGVKSCVLCGAASQDIKDAASLFAWGPSRWMRRVPTGSRRHFEVFRVEG